MDRTQDRLMATTTFGGIRPASRVALLPLIAALAGCATPRLNVEKQWEESMLNLNMFAFYPITEDVQIGDVFLYAPESGNRGGRQFRLTRIDTIDPRGCVVAALAHQQARRLRIEPTANEIPAKTKATPAAIAVPAGCNLAAPDLARPSKDIKPAGGADFDVGNPLNVAAPIRLRRVAIPAFTAATLTSGQLSGAGIFGTIGAALGLSASSDTAITVTLTNVEEIGIYAADALRLEEQQGARFLSQAGLPEAVLFYVGQARPDLVPNFCRADFDAFKREGINFFIANRVMYAHTIEYGYQNSQQVDLLVQANIAASASAAALPTAPKSSDGAGAGAPAANAPQSPATPAASGKVPSPADVVAQLKANAAASNAALKAATPQSPGVTASLGIGRFGTSALNVTYEQPLAVGVGTAITLPVGELVRLGYLVAQGKHPLPQVVPAADQKRAAAYRSMMDDYAAVRRTIEQSFKNVGEICSTKYRIADWENNFAAFHARAPLLQRSVRPGL